MLFDDVITNLSLEEFKTLCSQLDEKTYPHNYLLLGNPRESFKIDNTRAYPEDFEKLMTSLSKCKKVNTLSIDLVDFRIEGTLQAIFCPYDDSIKTAMPLFANIIETQLSSLELRGARQPKLLGVKNPITQALDAVIASDKLRCLKLFLRGHIVDCTSKVGEIIRKNTLEELTIGGIDFYYDAFIISYAERWKPLMDGIQLNTSLNRLEIIDYTGVNSDHGNAFLHDLARVLLGKEALRAVNVSSSRLPCRWPKWTLWGKPSFPLMQMLKNSNIVEFGFSFYSTTYGLQEPNKEEIQVILNNNKARLAADAKGALSDVMHKVFKQNQPLLSLYECKVMSNEIFSFADFPETQQLSPKPQRHSL